MDQVKNETTAKKELTKKEKTKKILGIIGNTLIWIFVVFSFLVTVLTISSLNDDDGLPNLLGVSPVTVLSGSMSPTFEEGDMIICKRLTNEEKATLKPKSDTYEGDVVTFLIEADVNGDGEKEEVFNTHRIVEVREDNGQIYYITQGDNKDTNKEVDSKTGLYYSDVLAQWTGGRIGGLGKFMNFLAQPTGFLIVIVIPLVLFFLYELYVVISTVVSAKAKKAVAGDEEEIKRRAIEEYIRQQQAEAAANAKAEDKADTDTVTDAGGDNDKKADGENNNPPSDTQ